MRSGSVAYNCILCRSLLHFQEIPYHVDHPFENGLASLVLLFGFLLYLVLVAYFLCRLLESAIDCTLSFDDVVDLQYSLVI
jgi:hypothetical protein